MMRLGTALLAGVIGLAMSAQAQTIIASDSGSDAAYSGGWTNGSNGGTGFEAWVVTASGGDGGFGGNFIGDPATAGISGMSTETFGLFANGDAASFAQGDRDFSAALEVTQVFSLDWGINWDSGGGNKGFSIFSGGVLGDEIINVNNGGSSDITLNGANVGFGYGTDVMTWSFTYTATNNILVQANDRDGTGTLSTNITVTGAPDSFRVYASNLQADDTDLRQPYFDNFEIIPEPGTMALFGIGLLGLAGLRRRMK
jgi:hypothetical protein